ncbi:MAG: hypothetical protein MRY83_15345 [Flavobacteriales bacterium]|nr:hypothetical protein [Flavobacteriales bacterium]
MDLNLYLDKHCHFRLASGKSVYGVVWRVFVEGVEQLVFSSSVEYKKLKKQSNVIDLKSVQLNLIDSKKIIYASMLESA